MNTYKYKLTTESDCLYFGSKRSACIHYGKELEKLGKEKAVSEINADIETYGILEESGITLKKELI